MSMESIWPVVLTNTPCPPVLPPAPGDLKKAVMPGPFLRGLQQLGPWNDTLPISGVTSCQTISCGTATSLQIVQCCAQGLLQHVTVLMLLLMVVLTSPLKGVTRLFKILQCTACLRHPGSSSDVHDNIATWCSVQGKQVAMLPWRT